MFPFDFLLAYLSTFATLKPGDVVEVESSRLGILRNVVAEEQ